MLPNHSPLVIAEQFGTLEALYPGRIDLGLGRAPGDGSAHAARAAPRPPAPTLPAGRARAAGAARRPARRGRPSRRSRRGARTCRCGFSARASSARSSPATLGLPYAFASHFAPDELLPALEHLPRAVPAVRAAGAAVRDGRRRTSSPPTTTTRRGGSSLRSSSRSRTCCRGTPRPAAAADRRHRGVLDTRREGASLGTCCSRSFVGSAETVEAGLEELRRRRRARTS